MMRHPHARTWAAGVTAMTAMNAVMFLTFRLPGFGLHGDGILISSPAQSSELVEAWIRFEPLPSSWPPQRRSFSI